MAFGKGVAVWISGFLTFLAGLSTFNAVMLWVYKGADLIIELNLMKNILGIGGMPVTIYFWVSLIATFGFLGLTSLVAGIEPSPYRAVLKMIDEVEEGLADNRRKIEAAKVELFAKLETDRMERQQLFDTVNANIYNFRKEMRDMLEKRGKALQRAELEDVTARLETLERELNLPKPRLNSQNAPEEIKGIGPSLGVELRSIGITNVGKLITADPLVIAEKTAISAEMATRFQARAQLLMVPGVDENDAELLEEVGIRSRGELANQDPIHLSRRIAEVAKAYVEQGKITESENPTIEEVFSWIKHAKL